MPEEELLWICLDCGKQKPFTDMGTEVAGMATFDGTPVGSCKECKASLPQEEYKPNTKWEQVKIFRYLVHRKGYTIPKFMLRACLYKINRWKLKRR
tara:strand:+ start:6378 stop:6665 length:288 start_codon:yes stop_codon:yes gene_type:complete